MVFAPGLGAAVGSWSKRISAQTPEALFKCYAIPYSPDRKPQCTVRSTRYGSSGATKQSQLEGVPYAHADRAGIGAQAGIAEFDY
jgi:hypothetical protein